MSPRGLAALFVGAGCIAFSAIFVRLATVDPLASAFWRAALAAPVLWALAAITASAHASPRASTRGREGVRGRLVAAGLFFGGDLAVWHWSIVLTSVANATLLANSAPIFVTLALWLIWHERPSPRFVVALFTALGGAVLLVGGDLRLAPASLLGDALGVATAVFYAAYQLTLSRIGNRVGTLTIMATTTTVTAAALLPLALLAPGPTLPDSPGGWLPLAGLALVSQVIGQSLIAHGIARLPTLLSSVGLLFQPVMAGVFAWLVLDEAMTPAQIAGALVVLIGIGMARASQPR